jgi:hypothetical protein
MCGMVIQTVNDFIVAHRIPTVRVKRGNGKRTLVDLTSLRTPTKRPGKIFNAHDAAKLIGIPHSVLVRLRRDGVYEVANLPVTRRGFHERDIAEFVERLGTMAVPEVPYATELVNFGCTVKCRRIPWVVKVSLIKRVLSGEIALFGLNDGTIHELLLPKAIVDEAVARERDRLMAVAAGADLEGQSLLGQRAVARRLGLSCSVTARKLAESGMLRGAKAGGRYVFTQESVEAFCTKWISLASLAPRAHTSAWGLMHVASRLKMKMIILPLKSPGASQGFVRVTDVDRLLAEALQVLGRQNRAKRQKR